jgi:F-type H+-transporting ATPase subunit delta
MSVQVIARRYATALADVALKRGDAAQVKEELHGWAALIKENANLKEVFGNPTVPAERKRKLLSTLLDRSKVGNTTANFLQVLLTNGRLTEIAEVSERFGQVLEERAGIVAAQVTTARPVAPDTQEALRARLAAMTGKQVRLNFATDPELIGGLVTRVGSTIYDGSVRGQLQQVKEKMINS